MEYSLEQRKAKALELRKQGGNCCQCVVMAFDDVTGIDNTAVARLAEGFGSGFGAMKEVCGTMSGATMVCGMAYSDLDRKGIYDKVRSLMTVFENHEGSYLCRELKQPGRKPCTELIIDAVEMIHKQLEADGK